MLAIDSPPITPMRGGLLTVAEVIDTDGAGGVLLNGITYKAHLCGKNRTIPLVGAALAAPVLTGGATNTTGGTFGPGQQFWKLTAVTGYGETIGSNEITATFPSAPTLSLGTTATTGGTFTAGAKFWKVTAIVGGGETAGSNEVTATLVANGTQVLNWTSVASATGYKVYRGTTAGGQNILVATLGAVLTYTDTGIAGTAGTVPAGTGSKDLSWASVSGAERYKLYRGTTTNGQNVLVATLGASATGYTDTGLAGTAATVPSSSTAGNIPPAAKTFDQQTTITGTPFGTYRGVEGALLVNRDEALAETQSAYSAGESYGVERGLQVGLFSSAGIDITPTPGTPVTNARQALGLLEQYAADNYSGLPIISGNRLAVGYIPELVVGENQTLHTIHGTPVVSAAGYSTDGPGAAVAGAGQAWLYISGKITIWRGPGGPYEAYDLEGNRVYGLMERTYVPTVECFVAAILVGI